MAVGGYNDCIANHASWRYLKVERNCSMHVKTSISVIAD